MNIYDFQKVVLAYCKKQATDVTINGIDLSLVAANNAKKWAQNETDFEYCRKTVSYQVNLSTGVDIRTAILWPTNLSDDPVAVNIKRLTRRAFNVATRDGTAYLGQPIDVLSRDAESASMRRKRKDLFPDQISLISPPPVQGVTTQPIPYLTQHGNILFMMPPNPTVNTSPLEIAVDAYIYLPDYSPTYTEDFFLNECLPWMILRTVQELNLILKDSQQVQVDTALLKDRWDNVLKWNDYISSELTDKDLS